MDSITPKEYLKIQRRVGRQINRLWEKIHEAFDAASECPLPQNLRPATAKDIVLGAIIWYQQPERYQGESYHVPARHYWHIVHEVLHPDDAFKAYVANDGCRYGLEYAFVEEE